MSLFSKASILILLGVTFILILPYVVWVVFKILIVLILLGLFLILVESFKNKR